MSRGSGPGVLISLAIGKEKPPWIFHLFGVSLNIVSFGSEEKVGLHLHD